MSLRVFFALLSVPALLAQSAAKPEEVPQEAIQLFQMHDFWGPKASSPNLTLSLVEESQVGASFRYGLKATGVPAGAVFTLGAWPVTQKQPEDVLHGVTFNKDGVGICAGRPGTCGDPANPDDPIHIPFVAVPGEPIRVAIVSSDGALKAFAKVVPIPVQGEDRGCKVSATLLTPGAELLFLEGTGFAPNSEIVMASDSEGEKHDFKGKGADAQGRYTSAVLPYKTGLTHGTVNIVLKGSSCSPAVKVAWGKRN